MTIPPGQSCGACAYGIVDLIGITHCCHSPPQWQRSVVPASGPPGAPPPAPGLANFSATLKNWPVVDPTDWCGEYSATTPPIDGQIFTVDSLPAPDQTLRGTRAFVSDQKTGGQVGSALSGGGSLFSPAYCDGTQWLQG